MDGHSLWPVDFKGGTKRKRSKAVIKQTEKNTEKKKENEMQGC